MKKTLKGFPMFLIKHVGQPQEFQWFWWGIDEHHWFSLVFLSRSAKVIGIPLVFQYIWWETLENPFSFSIFSNYFQWFPIFLAGFQFSNYFDSSGIQPSPSGSGYSCLGPDLFWRPSCLDSRRASLKSGLPLLWFNTIKCLSGVSDDIAECLSTERLS